MDLPLIGKRAPKKRLGPSGVAAAVQLAIFPLWLGATSIIGLPGLDILRLGDFF